MTIISALSNTSFFPREEMCDAGQQMVEGHDWLSLLLHQPLAFPYSSRLPLLQLALPDSGDFSFCHHPSSIVHHPSALPLRNTYRTVGNPSSDESTPEDPSSMQTILNPQESCVVSEESGISADNALRRLLACWREPSSCAGEPGGRRRRARI